MTCALQKCGDECGVIMVAQEGIGEEESSCESHGAAEGQRQSPSQRPSPPENSPTVPLAIRHEQLTFLDWTEAAVLEINTVTKQNSP